MKILLPLVSYVGLALVIVPALAYLSDWLEKGAMTSLMAVGTIVWFGSVPFWMDRRASE